MAQGFSQVPGMDYGVTFTPVVKPASVPLLLALACQCNWELDTFDAKEAFLWEVLMEEIYMCQLKGFKDRDWMVTIWCTLHTIHLWSEVVSTGMEWSGLHCYS